MGILNHTRCSWILKNDAVTMAGREVGQVEGGEGHPHHHTGTVLYLVGKVEALNVTYTNTQRTHTHTTHSFCRTAEC